jgi:ankyrin repeat protein
MESNWHYQWRRQQNPDWPNIVESDGRTPLLRMVSTSIDGVRTMLGFGAHPDDTGNGDFTPLTLSVYKKSIAMTEELLKFGADPNKMHIPSGTVSLHIAARDGNVEILNLLIKYNADIDKENFEGKSAMNFAAMYGRSDIIEILTQKGAEITPAAIHAARTGGHLDLALQMETQMVQNKLVRLELL